MKSVFFDPVAGASGDMILAALFDLGATPERVTEVLRSSGLEGFRITFSHIHTSHHMTYGHCEVECSDTHSHRHLPDILAIVENADTPHIVRDRAVAIFTRLAEAEASVHGIPVEKVHFHEVGAIDTIVDVLGACVALHELEAGEVYCSDFKVGRGTLTCSHGVLPVPAPATAKLLEGQRITRLDVHSELTTPTGAAILTTLSNGDWGGLTGTLLRTGTGHGTREFDELPNIVRAHLVESGERLEYVDIVETDIDDQSPEVTAVVPDVLREHGALDVVTMPLTMKKGRIGTRLHALVRAGDGSHIADLLFRHSSTLGVRISRAQRFVLSRSATTSDTPWGPVRAKKIQRPQGIEVVPEADACVELARKANVSVREIMHAAHRFFNT